MKRLIILTFIVFLAFSISYAQEEGQNLNKKGKGEEVIAVCPVMLIPATEAYSYVHEGKTYYFCCEDCVEAFKKDPQKHISRIKEIAVEAFQFGFSPDPIKVKKGDIVRLIVRSRDVTHGFSIKEYGIKAVIKKDEPKQIEFIAKKGGEFEIACSVYCGTGHSGMKAKLIVEE